MRALRVVIILLVNAARGHITNVCTSTAPSQCADKKMVFFLGTYHGSVASNTPGQVHIAPPGESGLGPFQFTTTCDRGYSHYNGPCPDAEIRTRCPSTLVPPDAVVTCYKATSDDVAYAVEDTCQSFPGTWGWWAETYYFAYAIVDNATSGTYTLFATGVDDVFSPCSSPDHPCRVDDSTSILFELSIAGCGNTCVDPPNVTNADGSSLARRCSNAFDGAICAVDCLPGYIKQGGALICDDGTWRGDQGEVVCLATTSFTSTSSSATIFTTSSSSSTTTNFTTSTTSTLTMTSSTLSMTTTSSTTNTFSSSTLSTITSSSSTVSSTSTTSSETTTSKTFTSTSGTISTTITSTTTPSSTTTTSTSSNTTSSSTVSSTRTTYTASSTTTQSTSSSTTSSSTLSSTSTTHTASSTTTNSTSSSATLSSTMSSSTTSSSSTSSTLSTATGTTTSLTFTTSSSTTTSTRSFSPTSTTTSTLKVTTTLTSSYSTSTSTASTASPLAVAIECSACLSFALSNSSSTFAVAILGAVMDLIPKQHVAYTRVALLISETLSAEYRVSNTWSKQYIIGHVRGKVCTTASTQCSVAELTVANSTAADARMLSTAGLSLHVERSYEYDGAVVTGRLHNTTASAIRELDPSGVQHNIMRMDLKGTVTVAQDGSTSSTEDLVSNLMNETLLQSKMKLAAADQDCFKTHHVTVATSSTTWATSASSSAATLSTTVSVTATLTATAAPAGVMPIPANCASAENLVIGVAIGHMLSFLVGCLCSRRMTSKDNEKRHFVTEALNEPSDEPPVLSMVLPFGPPQDSAIHPSVVDAVVQLTPEAVDAAVQLSPSTVDVALQLSPSTVDVAVQLIPSTVDVAVQLGWTLVDAATVVDAGSGTVDSEVQVSPLIVDAATQVELATCDVEVQLSMPLTADAETMADLPAIEDDATATSDEPKVMEETFADIFQRGSFSELQLLDDGTLKVSLTQEAVGALSMKVRVFHQSIPLTESPKAIYEDAVAAYKALQDIVELAEVSAEDLTVSYDQTFRRVDEENGRRQAAWIEELANNRAAKIERTIRRIAKPGVIKIHQSVFRLRPGGTTSLDWQFLLRGGGVEKAFVTWKQTYRSQPQEMPSSSPVRSMLRSADAPGTPLSIHTYRRPHSSENARKKPLYHGLHKLQLSITQ